MEYLSQELISNWNEIKAFFYFDVSKLSEPDMVFRLVLQVFLLFCSAFFSSSETALFSLSRLDLQQLRRERNPHSETIHALLDQPRRLIISILSGNELVNIAAAANMTAILVTLYGSNQAGWINLMVMIPLLLLFGEVTPKTIAVSNPVRYTTAIIASPMNLWVKLITPLRWAIRSIADRITTLIVGDEKAAENILQIDEFKTLVEKVALEGKLDATERALIYNLLEANDTEIVEIMTPRTQTSFLDASMSIPEMFELFKSYEHPRVPVYRNHRDNLVGFIHAEDVMRCILDKVDLNTLKLEDILHPPVVVPLTKHVDEIFDFFKEHGVRAAACLNEFGGVEGFVTMKDVLNFMFGQISDDVVGKEHYQVQDENNYVVPGSMKLTDFNNLTNFGIEDPRMTTIGGVAFRLLDRLPSVDDTVVTEGICIKILEMSAHRIARVQVYPYTAQGEIIQPQDTEDDDTSEEVAEAVDEEPTEKTGKTASIEDDSAEEDSAEVDDMTIDKSGKKDSTAVKDDEISEEKSTAADQADSEVKEDNKS